MAAPRTPSVDRDRRQLSHEQPGDRDRFHVLIAGAGVAGLEAMFALRTHANEHAGLAEQMAITVLTPESHFLYRPLTVLEPLGHYRARRYPLAPLVAMAEADLISDALDFVDPDACAVHTGNGSTLSYDALLLALGAHPNAVYPHAVTIAGSRADEIHAVLDDIARGYVRDVAFVVAPRIAWPLPLYELALITAMHAREWGRDVKLTIVTPEDVPLAIFGMTVANAVARQLAEAGIDVLDSSYAQVPDHGVVSIRPGYRSLRVDRVIALPLLVGPAVRGLPIGEHGFIAAGPTGHVRGQDRIFAAGDATEFPVKHGSIAAQQAEVAADWIARLAGIPIEPADFRPVLFGKLLTGGKPRYLTARISGGAGFASEISDQRDWHPNAKIAAPHLTPALEAQDVALTLAGHA